MNSFKTFLVYFLVVSVFSLKAISQGTLTTNINDNVQYEYQRAKVHVEPAEVCFNDLRNEIKPLPLYQPCFIINTSVITHHSPDSFRITAGGDQPHVESFYDFDFRGVSLLGLIGKIMGQTIVHGVLYKSYTHSFDQEQSNSLYYPHDEPNKECLDVTDSVELHPTETDISICIELSPIPFMRGRNMSEAGVR